MTASTLPVAGTMDGGRIRTLAAPFAEDPDSAAVRAVLSSWCYANGLTPGRMLEREKIEIHALDAGELARDRHEIHWRQVNYSPDDPELGRGREARTTLRKTPLVLEPAGLLADELTCGHVLTAMSPVLGAPALLYVCDQHIDPRTGRHPAQHAGDWAGEHRPPSAGGPVLDRPEATTRRMSWDNEHPGDLAFRDGVPYLGDMDPHIAHALVLARLGEITERRPRVNRRLALMSIMVHARGLREIALRHEPRATRDAGTVCNHDYVSATGITPWPCVEVRDALAGITAFAPEPAR